MILSRLLLISPQAQSLFSLELVALMTSGPWVSSRDLLLPELPSTQFRADSAQSTVKLSLLVSSLSWALYQVSFIMAQNRITFYPVQSWFSTVNNKVVIVSFFLILDIIPNVLYYGPKLLYSLCPLPSLYLSQALLTSSQVLHHQSMSRPKT